ncbi:kinase-like protein [Coccomyxa subellipsoidea C-169]|uniref:non-specific serine/threonine protein kinase n=1 Tax=Coccomyxa subellipsoidea (strain C-169) TaxID=574566 RepID=I0YVD8_COCSC|nr:kinase-like protein [Coccomyxa subellipsoidea C-169]EIE22357.1 kinase-like protein [Coccomyxa subellipsoidea C-169]|eukprot:XP_005646901.1 kinase-like protein [Coccomyxa subellipsoidea C-169]
MVCENREGTSTSKSIFEDPIIDLQTCQLVSQGAEAKLWKGVYLGRPTIVKQRFNKKYRHSTLDTKLTLSHLHALQEVRSILRARKLGVPTPVLYFVEHEASAIYMELVQGCSVKAALLEGKLSEEERHALLREIGRVVALLHDGGMVHGDLTTSNMLLKGNSSLVLIDFGLSSNTTLPEDKAVDLYVLERAFTSAHAASGNLFKDILASYRQHSRMWCPTLNKFAEVRMRGRKRTMVG